MDGSEHAVRSPEYEATDVPLKVSHTSPVFAIA
jgi:hypothetical protein